MKKLYTIFGFGLMICLFLANNTSSKITSYHALKSLRTDGSIISMTGAPGENNCVSCHGGAALDGNNGMSEMTIVGSAGNEYVPGETITLQLELTDGSAKNGFQLVALNNDNEMAGEFIITNGSQTQLNENFQLEREYVTHTSGGTFQTSWTFDWVTPVTGGEVTFYVAANKSSNIGSSAGAEIYLSQHTFTAEDLTNTSVAEKPTFQFDIAFLKNQNKVVLDFDLSHNADVYFNLVDLKGSSVYSSQLGNRNAGEFKEVVNLKNNLENGIYVATLFFDNKPVSKKIMVH